MPQRALHTSIVSQSIVQYCELLTRRPFMRVMSQVSERKCVWSTTLNQEDSRLMVGICCIRVPLQQVGFSQSGLRSLVSIGSERKTAYTKPHWSERLVGLVVKVSVSRAEDPGLESRLRRDFSSSNHTNDEKKKNRTAVATLPGAWRY